jgi:hypothetical protein
MRPTPFKEQRPMTTPHEQPGSTPVRGRPPHKPGVQRIADSVARLKARSDAAHVERTKAAAVVTRHVRRGR